MIVDVAPWLMESRWPTVPIRYVARLGTGHTPSRQHPEYWENCTIPWVTLADVKQIRDGRQQVISQTEEMISPLGIANSSAVRHPAGTVILSRTASVGFSALLGTDMATSQDFATWTCGKNIHPKFLLHSLRAMAPDLRRVAMGSTHKTIYMPDIANLRVALPPLDEQKRIADFLDAETTRIDDLVALRKKQSNLFTQRRRSYLSNRATGLKERYGSSKLSYLIEGIQQGWSPQCEDRQVLDGEWGVVKAGCVNGGNFNEMQHKALPIEVEPRRQYRIRSGDLLMSRASGSTDLIGSVAVVGEIRRKLLLCDKVYRIRASKGGAESRYLAFMLQTHPNREIIQQGVSGGEGMANNLPISVVRRCLVPLAPIQVQSTVVAEIETYLDTVETLAKAVDAQVDRMLERRQALITAAVTGQLDVITGRRVDLS